jgi:hypothetical protein
MNLESSKKVLRLSGFLTIVGAVLSMASGVMGLSARSSGSKPETNNKHQHNAGAFFMPYATAFN